MTPWNETNLTEACRNLIPKYNPWDGADGEYYYDIEAALRAVQFFSEVLTFSVAKWAGKPFNLRPWQAAIVGNLFGWKRISDKMRRYRKCLIFTARKSGKTELAAGIACLLLFCDGEPCPEIVSAAGNADQAARVFNAAAAMVKADSTLSSRATLFKRAIESKKSGIYKVINAAAKTKHGGNCSGVLIDELHCINDPELIDVLETSQSSRSQPLLIYTTTAGDNPESIAGEVYDYAAKVRDGIIDDPEFLPVMFEVPTGASISKRENWLLAQPNLGITVPYEEYERELKVALSTPRKMSVFRQLRLNQWVESSSAWLPIDDWKKCTGKVEPLPKSACFIGLDLSSTTDTTAIVAAFPQPDGKVAILPFVYLPKDNTEGRIKREKRDKAPYTSWIERGHITATPGNVVDYDVVYDKLIELSQTYDIREIQFDPYNASMLIQRLTAAGLNVVSVRQGVTLSEACKETERMVLSRQLIHPGNPCFTHQVSNAVAKTDARDNLWLDKKRSYSRIDSAVAMVMAINSAKFGAGMKAKDTAAADADMALLSLDW